MIPHPDDTIVALSSAAGPGARAVVRVSGPCATSIAAAVFTAAQPTVPTSGRCVAGHLRLSDIASPLPADLLLWSAPRTYTGQDLVELHTNSCPPLLELLIAALLRAGARAAQPGEFTQRAFLAGKIDLPRAEAILGVIEAGNRDQLMQALAQLAGGLTQPLQGLREDLLNLLADVEAGLDFAEEDIQFIAPEDLLLRISKGLAQLTLVHKQLGQRSLGERTFRVVLAGRPNAGKSSLFNALGGNALVSPQPGTTRDYLMCRLDLDGIPADLVDTAGRQEAAGTIEQQSQSLGSEQVEEADLVILCLEAGQRWTEHEQMMIVRSAVVGVATKCDLFSPESDLLPTSTVTGTGLVELRSLLAERARRHAQPPLAPSLSRCRHHVEACLCHLRRAHEMVLFEEPPELLALEVRGALEQLGAMVGAIYTDDLLDRVFSRFCIGK